MKTYAYYVGDKFIDIGTRKELSKKYNIKPEIITNSASPSGIKRREKQKTAKGKIFCYA